MLPARMQGSFSSGFALSETVHPGVCAALLEAGIIISKMAMRKTDRRNISISTRVMEAGPRLKRLGSTIVGNTRELHRIVDHAQVCRLVLPVTPAFREIFPLSLKSIHPLADN